MAYSPTPYVVVIYPKRLGDFGGLQVSDKLIHPGITDEEIADLYKKRCEEIKDQVLRHCDEVQRAFVVKEEDV